MELELCKPGHGPASHTKNKISSKPTNTDQGLMLTLTPYTLAKMKSCLPISLGYASNPTKSYHHSPSFYKVLQEQSPLLSLVK